MILARVVRWEAAVPDGQMVARNAAFRCRVASSSSDDRCVGPPLGQPINGGATVRKLLPQILVLAILATCAAPVQAGVIAAATPSGARADTTSPMATTAKRRRRVCDRNYKGRCLRPHASDYDCAGGSGNGPYYVRGPFTVVGNDHYGLDSDDDGVACES